MNHQFKPVNITMGADPYDSSFAPRGMGGRMDMHTFPTAAEYDQQYRQKQRRTKMWIGMAMLLGVSILIAVFLKKKALIEDVDNSSTIHHDNYEVVSATKIAELNCDLVVYQHRKSKTEILSLIPSDAEQDGVFGLSFKTLPEDSSGAANVLMKSLWDGSAHFPLKSPVEELKRGSLQTYLKAKTFDDRTTFCAASRHLKDFSNLMHVMLDSVFKPLCTQKKGYDWIFRQEGWRLEQKGEDYSAHDLKFNGVTFNQMKGIYDDPDQLIKRHSRQTLMPDTHYQYDADGEPQDILDLTQSAMVKFYEKYYHPSNAQVFLYGKLDFVKEGLDVVDKYASQYKARLDIPIKAKAQWQPLNFDSPMEEIHSFPSIVEDDTYQVMMTWLINPAPLESRFEYAWHVLEYLLIGAPDSIMRKTLETSTLGTEAIGGLDTTYQQWTFSVGMKGVWEANVKDVEKLIQDTFQQIVDGAGFTTDQRAAAMNTVNMRVSD